MPKKHQNHETLQRKIKNKISFFYKFHFSILLIASLLLAYFLVLVSIEPKSIYWVTEKIEEVLTLLNDNFVISRVRASAVNSAAPNLVRRLLSGGLGNKQIVDEMYLTVLGRYPAPEEETASLRHFDGRDRTQATENLLWALLNKVDFIFNY